MAKLSIRDLNVTGKRVLMRVDYNVPMEEKDGAMVINDTTRIKETLPTLELLISKGARIILAAHLGRPDGKREASMSLAPVAVQLAKMLGRPVSFVDETVGEKAEAAAAALKDGEILVLENVRFQSEEEANDPVFAARLARLADVYVNDAFGAAHRAHASTSGVARIVRAWGGQAAAGLLMERELKFLGDELENPARPFVVILGGAKVSDKIKVIDCLLDKADTILIGGAMAYTFKLAHGGKTGKSLVEKDHTGTALAAEAKAADRGVSFLLPTDTVIADLKDTGKVNKKAARSSSSSTRASMSATSRTIAKASTSGPRRPRPTPPSSPVPAPSSGTARWACSRIRGSPPAPTRSPKRSWPRRRTAARNRSSAAVTA